MVLINGFGRASQGFGLDPPTRSGQAWGSLHEKFENVMMSHDFQINECGKCVFVKD